ncbi:putative quinol monooxygenase, partial [Lentilactobacillus hilgardii]
MSGGHVVVVDLGIGDGHLERFMPLLLENARRSLAKEAGCLRFDVCRDAE